MKKDKQTHQHLMEKYGIELQEDKHAEEMSECLAAFFQYRKNPTKENYKKYVSEIADVEITTKWLKMSIKDVKKQGKYKMKRLRVREGLE